MMYTNNEISTSDNNEASLTKTYKSANMEPPTCSVQYIIPCTIQPTISMADYLQSIRDLRVSLPGMGGKLVTKSEY